MKLLIVLFFLIIFSIQNENILTAEEATKITQRALETQKIEECKAYTHDKIIPDIKKNAENAQKSYETSERVDCFDTISLILKKSGYEVNVEERRTGMMALSHPGYFITTTFLVINW